MKIELEQVSPHEIEKRSFEIITEELNGRTFPEDQELVVKRCIHTSADFDYADNLCFSEHAVAKGIEAIREGACIVTDTQMARSGINKKVLARHGGEALCFMSDEDVAARAKETGSTRAAACMEKAAELDKKLIIAVGNAPTALVRLYELIGEGKIKPALIIGVPVGFVNVVQSKEHRLRIVADFSVNFYFHTCVPPPHRRLRYKRCCAWEYTLNPKANR